MGGRGRSRTQRKHFRQNRENVWKRSKYDDSNNNDITTTTTNNDNNNKEQQQRNGPWEPFATQNLVFDDYYKEQGIVPLEEWDTFVGSLRTPLPAAFRINSSTQCYMDIRTKLDDDFMKSIQAEGVDGTEVEAIKPLPWYPENLAWQSNFSRNQLRKNHILGRFHEFLKLQNEIGNITRQEAVSMVPPLFLDVCPDHFVLDMCAAPGSKTFQLLEMIHHLAEPGSLPSGMIVANDVDVQRCNLLIHQTKRMFTANLIVTNHEAQHFPSCHLRNGSETQKVTELDINQLQFDRVLCDVPCSGDGTLRKAPDIWRKWNAGNGNGLHGLQIQIAMRGLSLLKVGGRMVYSTCSMNPIENEAVVAEVLQRCGGSVELVDVSDELPKLVRRPGLKKWKVRDKGMWWASYKDVPDYRRAAIVTSMFPSGKTYDVDASEESDDATRDQLSDDRNDGNYENGIQVLEDPATEAKILDKEVSSLPLERCMRIAPHDQNSGAFFISVFHKLSPLRAAAFQQKKPVSLHGKLSSSNDIQAESLTTKAKVDVNDEDIELVDSVGSQEVTMDDASDLQAESLTTKVIEDEIVGDVKPMDSIGIQEAVMDGTDEPTLDTELSETLEKNEKEETQPSTDTRAEPEAVRGKRKLQMQGKWRGVDPVIFYREEAVVGKIKDFYGIKESFPFEGHLITRNSDINHVKRIYYVSKSVKEVLQLNFLAGQQLKIASVGLKMFERQTAKDGSYCIFRISSEGLPLLLPYITKQILYASPVDFKHLLQYKSIKFGDFVDAEFGEKASKQLLGCCVVVLTKDNKTLSDIQADPSTIAIGCWRGRANISVMITALDCQELLERMSMSREEEQDSSLPENKPSTAEADEIVEEEKAEVKEDTEKP